MNLFLARASPQKLSIKSFRKDLEIMTFQTWENKAAEKRASILAKIPAEWMLSPNKLEEAAQQRDITGSFIQKFLTAAEVDIVTRDSVQIVDAVRDGSLTALQVTYSFCKTAAIAHQIVTETLTTSH
jgi:amidase